MSSALAAIADEVAGTIAAAWAPSLPDGVERTWGKQIGLDADSPYPLLTGRQVYVLPGAVEQVDPFERSCQMYRYTVGVLVAERYAEADGTAGPAGEVPADWVDERVAFVEQMVFAPLSDPALAYRGGVVRGEIGGRQRIDVPVDRELLLTKRVFWCPLAFTFIELE